ncbi:MAG: RsmE family RNA methyltransferase [Actinomycetota bacterium]
MSVTGPDGDGSADADPPRDRVLVLVDDLQRPELTDDDRRHLERSLRLRPGTPITVADGVGRWRSALLGPDVEPDGPVRSVSSRPNDLVVGFAPVKGDRSELIVQKLTELGVEVIVPLVTERSVVRWDGERGAKHQLRLARVAREAAMQSRNPRLPRLEGQRSLADFLGDHPGALLADPDGTAPPSAVAAAGAVAIGPEGGFSPAERQGRATVRLPGRILRTETAAIAAAVLLVGGT